MLCHTEHAHCHSVALDDRRMLIPTFVNLEALQCIAHADVVLNDCYSIIKPHSLDVADWLTVLAVFTCAPCVLCSVTQKAKVADKHCFILREIYMFCA